MWSGNCFAENSSEVLESAFMGTLYRGIGNVSA